jgi:hypothetical protein
MTDISVLVRPESPLWKWVLAGGTSFFSACALVLLVDLGKPGSSKWLLFGVGAGSAVAILCSLAIYWGLLVT